MRLKGLKIHIRTLYHHHGPGVYFHFGIWNLTLNDLGMTLKTSLTYYLLAAEYAIYFNAEMSRAHSDESNKPKMNIVGWTRTKWWPFLWLTFNFRNLVEKSYYGSQWEISWYPIFGASMCKSCSCNSFKVVNFVKYTSQQTILEQLAVFWVKISSVTFVTFHFDQILEKIHRNIQKMG